jgi:hypothetical protein
LRATRGLLVFIPALVAPSDEGGEQVNTFIDCREYDETGAGFLKSRVYAKLLRRLILEMLSDF